MNESLYAPREDRREAYIHVDELLCNGGFSLTKHVEHKSRLIVPSNSRLTAPSRGAVIHLNSRSSVVASLQTGLPRRQAFSR